MPEPAHPVVRVWWLDTRDVPEHAARALSSEEKSRADANTDGDGAQQLAAGSLLLRSAVALLLGRRVHEVTVRRRCPHCSVPHGRPEVPGSDLRVSVSHSGCRVAVAVSRSAAVGVDVEAPRTRPLSSALLRRALTATERHYLLRLPVERQAREFLRAWTAKEAILKATGEGLHGGPRHLDLHLGSSPLRLHSWAGSASRAHDVHLVELEPGAGHVAYLATIGVPRPSVTCGDGLPLVERMLG